MKTSIPILILVLLLSCKQTKTYRHKSTLKIAVNSNYTQYLWYPSISLQAKDSTYYDSVSNAEITKFDSLKNGKVQVSIFSLLTDDFETIIDLKDNITISFDTTFYSSFKKTHDFEKFSNLTSSLPDTFYIGQKVVGCFTGNIEKLKIFRQKDDKFKIEYSNSGTKNYVIRDSLFENHFANFLSKSKFLFPDKENSLTFAHLSTTRTDTYIRIGNTILEFPDLYNWKGYDNFKNNIGISIK